MLLGAFRGGNPLERVVGVPSLWPRLGGVLQQHGLGVSRQLDSEQSKLRIARHPPVIGLYQAVVYDERVIDKYRVHPALQSSEYMQRALFFARGLEPCAACGWPSRKSLETVLSSEMEKPPVLTGGSSPMRTD